MSEIGRCLTTRFATAMARLGPFEPKPSVAMAVSGGADSMALAILTSDWTRRRGGSTLAIVVNHGLRPASADEARITVARLTGLGIRAKAVAVACLKRGSALAERARIMRYEILINVCRQAGVLHLLLGHHAGDQAETVAMRVLRGSQTPGLAGMSALREVAGVRLLRPLLEIEPAGLRRFLDESGVGWVEDPSNNDMRAMRSRLRHGLAAHRSTETGLSHAISAVARLRSRQEAEIAAELAGRATVRPEGFALLSHGRIGRAALSSLIRTIGAMAYPPNPDQISDLAAHPRPATVAGVRIMPAGRFSDGDALLMVREESAIMKPIEVSSDTIWDGRFRLISNGSFPEGASIGKLGDEASGFRLSSDLPSAILRTLPALRFGKVLAAVPHLGHHGAGDDVQVTVLFSPPSPVSGACFLPAR